MVIVNDLIVKADGSETKIHLELKGIGKFVTEIIVKQNVSILEILERMKINCSSGVTLKTDVEHRGIDYGVIVHKPIKPIVRKKPTKQPIAKKIITEKSKHNQNVVLVLGKDCAVSF